MSFTQVKKVEEESLCAPSAAVNRFIRSKKSIYTFLLRLKAGPALMKTAGCTVNYSPIRPGVQADGTGKDKETRCLNKNG
jgi:hypothetical protein